MTTGVCTLVVKSKRVRPGVVVLAISTLLIGLFCAWFLTNFDRVPVSVDAGFQKQARLNRLLAAELLLERFGRPASSHDALEQLPAVQVTLLLPVSRRDWSAQRTAELAAWVRSGGHLIAVAESADEEGSNDTLLQQFGVASVPVEADAKVAAGVKDVFSHYAEVDVRVDDSERLLQVSFNANRGLLTEREPLAATATAVHAVSFVAGQGRLTVLSDARFLTNSYLAEHDHGAFLWYLVSQTESDDVWLVHRNRTASLWQLMYASAWPVLVGLGVISMLLLWTVSRRFGPLLPATSAPRRRLLEHIEASGRFLWRHGKAMSLVDDSRQTLLRTLELRHPGWAAADDLASRLSNVTGVDVDTIERVLNRTSITKEDDFVNTMRVLETMRKQL